MNDKDIYSAIGESFDDKIKLDFDDVKKRIAALENKDSAVISSITPSSNKKKYFYAVTAAAACLVFIIGLSSAIAFNGGMAKSEAAADSYMMYDSSTSLCEASDDVLYAEAEDSAEYFDEETISESFECAGTNSISDFGYDSYDELEVSESDISNTDISSQTDMN